MPTHGIFIGRFQPFHKGHQAMIQKIIDDGLIPVVVVGSVNSTDKVRNPHSFEEVKAMITAVNPDIICQPLPDYKNDNPAWAAHLKRITPPDSVLYYCRKEEDVRNGVHYLDFIPQEGIAMHAVEPAAIAIPIRATQIRHDFEEHKHHLHSAVYDYLLRKKNAAIQTLSAAPTSANSGYMGLVKAKSPDIRSRF